MAVLASYMRVAEVVEPHCKCMVPLVPDVREFEEDSQERYDHMSAYGLEGVVEDCHVHMAACFPDSVVL